MATSSLSKGCFVFRPDKSVKKKKKTVSVEDYFNDGSEDMDNSNLRFRLYQKLQNEIRTHTEALQDQLSVKVLASLLEFITNTSALRSGSDPWSSRMKACEIPTAALGLGVNVPDHAMTFQSLSEMLQRKVTPYVVSVQASECGTLKHLMQRVFERLIGARVAVDEDDDDTEQRSTPANQKRAHCSLSLSTLCDWYTSKTKKSSTATPDRKRSHSSVDQHLQEPPVIIIFKDLEAFNPRVLQDFISICSGYVDKLPLVFILGIATSPSTIQNILPHSVLSLLGIQLFQSLSCTQHLASVIDQLILTPAFPFKLTAKVLQVLVGIFLYHDFSVHNFIKGLQLALLEHFHSQPLSVLCCEEAEARAHASQLGLQDLERVRQLPSFRRYVETQEPQEQVKLLTSDEYVKEVCQRSLKDLGQYHNNYYAILRCLHVLTSSLPKFPLGKQIRELHISCLEKNVWENEEYQSAMQLLRMLAKDDLFTALQTCANILDHDKSSAMRDAHAQLNQILVKFNQLDKPLGESASAEDNMTSPGKDVRKKTDLAQLQKSLLEMKGSLQSKKMSQFETLRNEALEFIDRLVRMHLAPPDSQLLFEVYYYSSSAVLRRHLNATPRTSIQTALSNPYHYLQNDSLQTEDGTVSNAAPDICIAYKLHLECGRLINLYDWLEAYATVASAAEGTDPSSEDYGKVDELKHARFIQAVSELEFLGFIKSTKQKTDHVARLTWGGC